MREALVILSGFFAGLVQWLPCGVGLAAHRYKLGGAVIRSTNPWVLLGTRHPNSFSFLGKIGFVAVMLVWSCIFFGSMVVPALVAELLGMSKDSPFILYAIYANLSVAVFAFFFGPAIWRRLAL
jgi:hypothetical protein